MGNRRVIFGDFTETHVVRVYRDSEWQEYVARVAAKGQPWYEPADYHTTDKQDAIDSARDMLRRCTEEGIREGAAITLEDFIKREGGGS